MAEQPNTGFRDLLISVMKRRWYITAMVLGGFMVIIAGVFAATAALRARPAATKTAAAFLSDLGVSESFMCAYFKASVSFRNT